MGEKESNAGVRYERTDIRLGCLLAVIVAGVCIMASVGYCVWRFYWWQAGMQESAKKSLYGTILPSSTKLPPEPRLEQIDRMASIESSNVAKRQAAQEKILNSYGPAEEKGFVHIPIRQAMKIIAGKLPVRKQSPGNGRDENGLIDAGQSNSGRMFRGGQP
jgi:hypothetical protein